MLDLVPRQSRAMTSTVAEIIRIAFLLRDLDIHLSSLPLLFCDDINLLLIDPVFYVRTKHMELDYHYVRKKKVVLGALVSMYVCASIANLFT